MMNMAEKVVLAYSGGLDTSVIGRWLVDEGYDVICVTADLGQKEDFKEAKRKALEDVGASKFVLKDVKREFVEDFIFPCIRTNAIYEGRYLMGTSMARPLIAKAQMEVAKKERAKYVSHGATGKGNDQVRFELSCYYLDPDIRIIAPWRDPAFLKKFKGRDDMIRYAKRNGIPVKATADKPWSSDPNIAHISYEAGKLEDPFWANPEEMFEMTVSPEKAPDKPTRVSIYFNDGTPTRVVNMSSSIEEYAEGSLELFTYLNEIGGENGIGRVDMVENRYVGIKSRGVYEAPAHTILRLAHMDIEGLTMDREVMHRRDEKITRLSEYIYNGYWFAPECRQLFAEMEMTQKNVTGMVRLDLYKGNVIIRGRKAPEECSLYEEGLASMHKEGGFDPTASTGFIKTNATRLKTFSRREQKLKSK